MELVSRLVPRRWPSNSAIKLLVGNVAHPHHVQTLDERPSERGNLTLPHHGSVPLCRPLTCLS